MKAARDWLVEFSSAGNPDVGPVNINDIAAIQADALRHASGIVAKQEALWPSFKAIRETLDEQINQLESALK